MVLNLKSKKFTQLIEHNQHEGESWSFWLQVDDIYKGRIEDFYKES